jgi:hypothetical protein
LANVERVIANRNRKTKVILFMGYVILVNL